MASPTSLSETTPTPATNKPSLEATKLQLSPVRAAKHGLSDDAQINELLLAAIPKAAKVLELGCATGRLGERYKQTHSEALWVGVDCDAEALAFAASRLDTVHALDLDTEDLAVVGDGFDCVVIGHVLEHLKHPERVLEQLRAVTTPGATVLIAAPNMCHISVIERLLTGDLAYEDAGLLDRNQLRWFSMSSLFKLLLDCGWLPHLQEQEKVRTDNQVLTEGLMKAAMGMKIPLATAVRYLVTQQTIVRCRRLPEMLAPEECAPVSVIVPVTNELQFRMNVLSSPGLQEIGAEVIAVRHAASAAEAYERGAQEASHAWRLFCHQDVYFPKGTGRAMMAALAEMGEERARNNVMGVVGIAVGDGPDPTRPAGIVVDRINSLDYPATQQAITVDELCVAIHRDLRYRLDPTLGWHLWATDLCLQPLVDPEVGSLTPIARVPLFHNSASDQTLPESFGASELRMVEKYPQMAAIVSLCSTFSRSTTGNGVDRQVTRFSVATVNRGFGNGVKELEG